MSHRLRQQRLISHKAAENKTRDYLNPKSEMFGLWFMACGQDLDHTSLEVAV